MTIHQKLPPERQRNVSRKLDAMFTGKHGYDTSVAKRAHALIAAAPVAEARTAPTLAVVDRSTDTVLGAIYRITTSWGQALRAPLVPLADGQRAAVEAASTLTQRWFSQGVPYLQYEANLEYDVLADIAASTSEPPVAAAIKTLGLTPLTTLLAEHITHYGHALGLTDRAVSAPAVPGETDPWDRHFDLYRSAVMLAYEDDHATRDALLSPYTEQLAEEKKGLKAERARRRTKQDALSGRSGGWGAACRGRRCGRGSRYSRDALDQCLEHGREGHVRLGKLTQHQDLVCARRLPHARHHVAHDLAQYLLEDTQCPGALVRKAFAVEPVLPDGLCSLGARDAHDRFVLKSQVVRRVISRITRVDALLDRDVPVGWLPLVTSLAGEVEVLPGEGEVGSLSHVTIVINLLLALRQLALAVEALAHAHHTQRLLDLRMRVLLRGRTGRRLLFQPDQVSVEPLLLRGGEHLGLGESCELPHHRSPSEAIMSSTLK